MSTRAYGSAAARLRATSLRLGAADHPYYLHIPRGHAEPAPGWYWRPEGQPAPVYLGYNSHDADYRLRRLWEQKQEADAAAAAALQVAA